MQFQNIFHDLLQVSASSRPTQQTSSPSVWLFRGGGPSTRTPVAVNPSATLPVDRIVRDTMCLTLRLNATGPASGLKVLYVIINEKIHE